MEKYTMAPVNAHPVIKILIAFCVGILLFSLIFNRRELFQNSPPIYLVNDDIESPNTEFYNTDGSYVANIPLSYIQFFSDGSTVGATQEKIIYSDANNKGWEKSLDVSHDISMTKDEKYIALIEEYSETLNHLRTYHQRILMLDRSGKTVFYWDAKDNIQRIESLIGKKIEPKTRRPKRGLRRQSSIHFNSVLEIPDDSYIGLHPSFRKGNLLVSCWNPQILITLDRNTQQLLWVLDINAKFDIQAPHTPLLEPNGVLSFFVNDFGNHENNTHRSGVLRWDTNNNSISKIDSFDGQTFYTVDRGSMAPLNGNFVLLFAHQGEIVEADHQGHILNIIRLDRTFSPYKDNTYYRLRVLPKTVVDNYLKNHPI